MKAVFFHRSVSNRLTILCNMVYSALKIEKGCNKKVLKKQQHWFDIGVCVSQYDFHKLCSFLTLEHCVVVSKIELLRDPIFPWIALCTLYCTLLQYYYFFQRYIQKWWPSGYCIFSGMFLTQRTMKWKWPQDKIIHRPWKRILWVCIYLIISNWYLFKTFPLPRASMAW